MTVYRRLTGRSVGSSKGGCNARQHVLYPANASKQQRDAIIYGECSSTESDDGVAQYVNDDAEQHLQAVMVADACTQVTMQSYALKLWYVFGLV